MISHEQREHVEVMTRATFATNNRSVSIEYTHPDIEDIEFCGLAWRGDMDDLDVDHLKVGEYIIPLRGEGYCQMPESLTDPLDYSILDLAEFLLTLKLEDTRFWQRRHQRLKWMGVLPAGAYQPPEDYGNPSEEDALAHLSEKGFSDIPTNERVLCLKALIDRVRSLRKELPEETEDMYAKRSRLVVN